MDCSLSKLSVLLATMLVSLFVSILCVLRPSLDCMGDNILDWNKLEVSLSWILTDKALPDPYMLALLIPRLFHRRLYYIFVVLTFMIFVRVAELQYSTQP